MPDRTVDLARMLDRISADLTTADGPGAVWDGALDYAQAVAA
ncbi:hypothetical protein ACIRG4_35225 [Streptomyces sp. NPDC102395]